MGFTLGSIFEFVVLIMNAFAILDEKRFLRKSKTIKLHSKFFCFHILKIYHQLQWL